jgi:colicin import membrane protein
MNRNRRTRDRVRLIFWACLTLVCFLLVVVARQQQTASLGRKLDAAETRVKRTTNLVIRPQLSRQLVSQSIEDGAYQDLLTVLQRKVLADDRVARVQVWGPDGRLVFSTEGTVAPNTTVTVREDAFESVSTGNVVSVVQTAQMPGRGEHDRGPTDLFATYVPLATDSDQFFGAVQIDQYYEDLVQGSSRPWAPLQVAFFVVGAICAVMVLLSFWWSSKPMNDAEVALRLDRATLKGAKAAGRENAKITKRDTKAIDDATSEVQRLRAKLDESDRARDAAKEQAKQLQEQVRAADQQVQAAQSELSGAQRAAQDAQEALRVAGEAERQLRAEIEMLRMEAQKVPEPPAGPSQDVFEAVQADLERAREEVQEAQLAAKRAQAEADELRAGMEQARQDAERARQDAEQAVAASDLARQQADDALGRLDSVKAEADEARAASAFTNSQLVDAQRKLDEAPATVEEVLPAEAQARIEDLEEQVRGLEQERAMLRAGRPETVYEVRNRELQDELKQAHERLKGAEEEALDAKAQAAGLAPNQLAKLEQRLAEAERRAEEAEIRLRELEPAAASANGNGANGKGNGSAPDEEPKPEIDGSELRSKLVRATDRKRLGADQKQRH